MATKKIIKVLDDMKVESDNLGMKTGAHPDSIDEKLYQENEKIIQLHYDRASKMASIGSSTFLGSAALTIAFFGKSLLGFRFFLITTILSLPRTLYRNVRMNKCFNTAIKKSKE